MNNYGATAQQWQHFSITLGLTDRLLPVACNPNYSLSPGTKIKRKDIGKIPAIAIDGRIMGYSGWRTKTTSQSLVDNWETRKYGMGIRTGNGYYGLDVDCNSYVQAQKIRFLLQEHFDADFDYRYREGSPRFLVLFKVEDIASTHELENRITYVRDPKVNAVEWRGDKCQFVACGTHPSTFKYQWSSDTPVPIEAESLQIQQFLRAVQELGYAKGSTSSGPQVERNRLDTDCPDPVYDWLLENAPSANEKQDGEILLDCPNGHLHSEGDGTNELMYMHAGYRPDGTVQPGMFSCFHTTCKTLTPGRDDWLTLLEVPPGIEVINDFEVIPTTSKERKEVDELLKKPFYKLSKAERKQVFGVLNIGVKPTSNGKITNSYRSVTAVMNSKLFPYELAFDTFHDLSMFKKKGARTWQRFGNNTVTQFCHDLEAIGFSPSSLQKYTKECAALIAEQNSRDELRDTALACKWDGVPRIANFFETYLHIPHSEWTVAVACCFWTGIAARAVNTGPQKFDHMLIVEGDEGILKSDLCRAIALASHMFGFASKVSVGLDEFGRSIRGRSIVEWPEMDGISPSTIDTVKARVTMEKISIRNMHKDAYMDFNVRCGHIGTTNNVQAIPGLGGERRWMPVSVTKPIDTAAIKRDRELLWAEAVHLFQKNGVMYKDVERLQSSVVKNYKTVDPWAETLTAWVNGEEGLDGTTTLFDPDRTYSYANLMDVLEVKGAERHSKNNPRIMATMKALGFRWGVHKDRVSAGPNGRISRKGFKK